MKTIIYSKTNVGRDAKNPLLDLREEDSIYYYETLIQWLGTISKLSQAKDYAWEQTVKRRPKQLSRGKSGANSVFSVVSGLLYNYTENFKNYGVCRLSQRQLDDVEFCAMFMHAIDDTHEVLQFREALFDIGGRII